MICVSLYLTDANMIILAEMVHQSSCNPDVLYSTGMHNRIVKKTTMILNKHFTGTYVPYVGTTALVFE